MKDYSVLEGLDNNFMIELRCAYDRGYRHGRDDEWAKTQVKQNEGEGYKRGLEDAWACAKRIIKLSQDMKEDIFNMRGDHFILDSYSAEEAIDIIKRYDKKKDKIKVGDKVRTLKDSDGVHILFPIGTVGIVQIVDEGDELTYKVSADGDYWWYRRDMIELVKDDEIKIGDEVRNMTNGCLGVVIKKAFEGYIIVVSSWGNTYSWETGRCNKTGKCYKQFAEAISSLQDKEKENESENL